MDGFVEILIFVVAPIAMLGLFLNNSIRSMKREFKKKLDDFQSLCCQSLEIAAAEKGISVTYSVVNDRDGSVHFVSKPKDEGGEVLTPYNITIEQQLDEWVKGNPIHNHNRFVTLRGVQRPMDGGECCPDFSCCNPKLLWPKEVREEFKKAVDTNDDTTKQKLLMSALDGLTADKSVYVAGKESSPTEH